MPLVSSSCCVSEGGGVVAIAEGEVEGGELPQPESKNNIKAVTPINFFFNVILSPRVQIGHHVLPKYETGFVFGRWENLLGMAQKTWDTLSVEKNIVSAQSRDALENGAVLATTR